jgi:hypothetical protein
MTEDDLLQQVHEINQNLALFINLFRYDGKYESYYVDIPANTQKARVQFSFPVRKIIIRANQQIKISLNDKRLPDIRIDDDEYPFELELIPGMLLDRVYITTGDDNTNVRILIFG